MQHQAITARLRPSRRIALPLLLSGTVMMSSACGPQGFGVGRNPLGRGVKEAVQATTATNNIRFDGNPDLLNSLFLRSKTKNILMPGQSLDLEVIALDRDGKRIDPAKLQLEFTSSENKHVTVDANGILTGLMPFESSQIKVTDKKSGASAIVDVTVGPKNYTGNPEALVSLALVLRQQTVPGKGEQAQYYVVAKDILGNPIDPSRLRLEWSLSKPEDFSVDKNGLVTALTATGVADLTVRDTVTGRITTGTVRNISLANAVVNPPTGTGNVVTTNPNPIPSGAPGVPVTPTGPSQGNPNPLQPPLVSDGTPGTVANITLTPAVSNLRPGERVQLQVALSDAQGRTINPGSVSLQWTSTEAGLPVDGNGVVTANTSDRTTRVTVSVPGTNLSASVVVNALSYPQSGGGGGGGGGGAVTPPPVVPMGVPRTYSGPLNTTSFNVFIAHPLTAPNPIDHYIVTIGNAPGTPTFNVPANGGLAIAEVPAAANLNPNTTYPYSVVAVDTQGNLSAVVNAFGTTLFNNQPMNLIGGSKDFSGVIQVPSNGSIALNRASGMELGAGDASNAETLTITLQPDAANFGTVSFSAVDPAVTVSGSGTQASPLVISGPKDKVADTLLNFVYTPSPGFQGIATVTMTNVDTVEGVATPDDVDKLLFSVNNTTPTPPQNFMNSNPVFASLNTALNTGLTLNPLNNSRLSVTDINGDELTIRLTPANGTLSLVSVPAGISVSGIGTTADPLVLVGRPYHLNNALNGGLTFTPTAGYTGPATITMLTTAPDGTDTDTVNITVIQPSNTYNANQTFPTPAVRMAKGQSTVFNGANNRALGLIYPAASTVRVNLVLLDEFGNNPGAAAHGDLAIGSQAGVTVTDPGPEGPGSLQLVGPVAAINTLLTNGLTYSPVGNTTGKYRLRMNSVDTINPALTDTNDILNLEVSETPTNRFNNSASAFPPINAPIELGFDTPLTFAGFFGTPLSVVDSDSSSITVTLTPSANGKLARANTNPTPAGVTVSSGSTTLQPGSTAAIEATNANPLIITGSPTNINIFLNNGIVFTPNQGFSGAATVTMKSDDGGGIDTDVAHINVLPVPENRRNDNPDFTTHSPIQSAPGIETDLGAPATRLLSVRNYPASNANVEVTLSVPNGKGTLRINGVAGAVGTLSNVNVSGNQTNTLTLIGSQTNLNTVLLSLRYTPNASAVAAPETVNLTMSSTGGPLGDSGDLVPFSISNPPRNTYNASETDANFPTQVGGIGRLSIFANSPLILDGNATATQPAIRLSVNDDSTNLTVQLTPQNNAIVDLTGAAPGTVTVTGGGAANAALTISGPKADVQTALGLLRYTPANNFTGNTSLTIVSSDGGPAPDTNTLDFSVETRPLNAFNGNSTFPVTNVLLLAGASNAFQNSGTNATIHGLSVLNLSSYNNTGTATVRLQVPSGLLNVTLSGGVTITSGSNGSGDLTLSATGANIPNLNTVISTLTYTAPALTAGVTPSVVILTMTHGPISDTDTLNLLATRAPLNLYNSNGTFPAVRRIANEGSSLTFTGIDTVSVGSVTSEPVEDSPSITVTLEPTSNSGTVNIPVTTGVTITGGGTTGSPRQLVGAPGAVNTALAGLSFTSNAGVNGNYQINIVSNDGVSSDSDSILLDVRARPANQVLLNGATSNTFPGTGAPRNVGINSNYLLDGYNDANNALDRPRIAINFYQPGDSVTVNLDLTQVSGTNLGSLEVTTTTGLTSVSGNNTGNLQLVGSQTNINNALASLIYHSPGALAQVDLTVRSDNGIGGSDNLPGTDANSDKIRLNVQNQTPVNSFSNTNSGFVNTSGNTPLPLRVVNEDDAINFTQTDPTSAASGNFTVTNNSWGTLTVADDDTTVTTSVRPPASGVLSFRSAPAIAPTGAGTNADPFVWTNRTPAEINAALALLRFTPNNGATGTANLTITTTDGANQSDTDNISILVESPNLPSSFNGNPNPTGSVFRAVYQLNRDKLPQIVVQDITVSGAEVDAGAQIQIIRYNDNDPTTTADDDTTVLRTVTLNAPNAALGESVAFNNQTNRATVTVDFSAAGSPILNQAPGPLGLKDGTGKIGGVLTGGGIDTPSTSSVAAANHPFSFFVFPERAQFAVDDYFAGPGQTNNRGRWYLINTSTSLGSGLGRLSLVFDSNGPLNLQTGLNASTDVTTGLAKDPINGDVYYIDQEGTNGRLIRWIPSLGIENDRGGANTSTDPFRVNGNLSVNNGNGTLYRFADKPARLVFNSTLSGTTKTATLYASANYQTVDGQNPFSGFYRIRNYNTSPVVDQLYLTLNGDDFGAFDAFLNNGDIVFEPDTDASAIANNRMFLTMSNRLYVTTAPVPDTGTADVPIQQVTIPAGVQTTLRSDGTAGGVAADQLVGLSIDGEWTTGNRSLLVIARYTTNGATLNLSRLYRLTYDSSYNITGATLLSNGNFGTPNYSAQIPLVDITEAHQP